MAAAAGRPTEPQFRMPNGQKPPSKSNSNILCKALIVFILLLVIPLFPSQAPDFITRSVFTEFWEILHLLFIGIAVCYGLFCRKSDQWMEPDRIAHSRNDELEGSYLSGISHLSSFFEDRFENMCRTDEHDDMHTHGNCGCILDSGGHILGRDDCVVHGESKIRDFMSDDVNEDNFGGNIENVNQTWCSKYVKGESLVVVSNGKCFVGESSGFEPLNLPVRSLRSMVVDADKTESNRSPKIEAMSNEDAKVMKIRGVVPMNLEKKFDEAAGPSSIPWKSNSGRVGSQEDKNNTNLHFRTHSVGEVEFERTKSRSYLDPKFSSSPELACSSMDNLENKKAFSVSRSKVAPLNGEALFNGAKSCGEEDEVGKGKNVVESLDSEAKSSALGKILSKAKSVRTIKPRRYAVDEKEQNSGQMGHRLGRIRNKFETDALVKTGSGDAPEDPLANHQNHEFDSVFPFSNPKPMLNEFHDEEQNGFHDHNVTESEEETRSELDRCPSEDGSRTNLDIDSELEGSEVDRKAGEFIAKFREQIRLQKISLAEG